MLSPHTTIPWQEMSTSQSEYPLFFSLSITRQPILVLLILCSTTKLSCRFNYGDT